VSTGPSTQRLTVPLGALAVQVLHDPADRDLALLLASRLRHFAVSPYLHTLEVRVSATEPSHSHPVLTIHASHIASDVVPLVFLHEQMHWALARSQPNARDALAALASKFASSEFDLVHLAVCRLEVTSAFELLGADVSMRLFSAVTRYEREYHAAFERGDEIDACICCIKRRIDA